MKIGSKELSHMNLSSSFSPLNNQASLKPMSHLRSGSQNSERLIEGQLKTIKNYLQSIVDHPPLDAYSWRVIKLMFKTQVEDLTTLRNNNVVENPTEKMSGLLQEIEVLKVHFLVLAEKYETPPSGTNIFNKNKIK
jgi:hypothetical protein